MFDYGEMRSNNRCSALRESPNKNASMVMYDRDVIYSHVSSTVVKSKRFG